MLVMVLTVPRSGIATVVFECEALALELMFTNMFAVILNPDLRSATGTGAA